MASAQIPSMKAAVIALCCTVQASERSTVEGLKMHRLFGGGTLNSQTDQKNSRTVQKNSSKPQFKRFKTDTTAPSNNDDNAILQEEFVGKSDVESWFEANVVETGPTVLYPIQHYSEYDLWSYFWKRQKGDHIDDDDELDDDQLNNKKAYAACFHEVFNRVFEEYQEQQKKQEPMNDNIYNYNNFPEEEKQHWDKQDQKNREFLMKQYDYDGNDPVKPKNNYELDPLKKMITGDKFEFETLDILNAHLAKSFPEPSSILSPEQKEELRHLWATHMRLKCESEVSDWIAVQYGEDWLKFKQANKKQQHDLADIIRSAPDLFQIFKKDELDLPCRPHKNRTVKQNNFVKQFYCSSDLGDRWNNLNAGLIMLNQELNAGLSIQHVSKDYSLMNFNAFENLYNQVRKDALGEAQSIFSNRGSRGNNPNRTIPRNNLKQNNPNKTSFSRNRMRTRNNLNNRFRRNIDLNNLNQQGFLDDPNVRFVLIFLLGAMLVVLLFQLLGVYDFSVFLS